MEANPIDPLRTEESAPLTEPMARLDQVEDSEEPPARARDQNHAGFWLFAGHLFTIFGLALSNVLFGLAAIWAGRNRSKLAPFSSGARQLLVPLGVYAVIFVVSAAASYEPATSFVELRDLFALATLPLAFLLVKGERQARLVVSCVMLMAVAFAFYGIGQYLSPAYGSIHQRTPGPFSHYMTFSGVLLLCICLFVSRVLLPRQQDSGRTRMLITVGLAVVLTAQGLTLTRSAWVATLLAITLGIVIARRRWLIGWAVTAVLVAGLVSISAPDHWQRFRSIFDLGDPSNYDRLCMVDAGRLMIAERPLFGIGPGLVESHYPIYRHPTAPRLHVVHLHNTFVHLAAERGLLSLAAYLWLMVAGLTLAWRRYASEGGRSGARADLYLAVILGIAALNLAGVFEANWRDTEIQRIMLFLLALPVLATPGSKSVPSEG